ncbi:PIN domain-containing protein [Nocardia gipuzkoensis]
MSAAPPDSYTQRLLTELDHIAAAYSEVLSASRIRNIDPNRGAGGGVVFLGFAKWGWEPSDPALEATRMAVLSRVRDLEPQVRLLFPHPTTQVAKRLDAAFKHLSSWLIRKKGARSVPATIEEAHAAITETIADLRALIGLVPGDEYAVRVVVDTNALIDNPDLAAYRAELGSKYVAHLLPVVLREIDELKRGGRNQDLRDRAKAAERRLKGIRSNGDVRTGVRVAGEVIAKFEHIEPRSADLPDWLDLDVPDDRFVASALLLQSQHPGSALYAATSDINLQTKLAAVGLPYVEP